MAFTDFKTIWANLSLVLTKLTNVLAVEKQDVKQQMRF